MIYSRWREDLWRRARGGCMNRHGQADWVSESRRECGGLHWGVEVWEWDRRRGSEQCGNWRCGQARPRQGRGWWRCGSGAHSGCWQKVWKKWRWRTSRNWRWKDVKKSHILMRCRQGLVKKKKAQILILIEQLSTVVININTHDCNSPVKRDNDGSGWHALICLQPG